MRLVKFTLAKPQNGCGTFVLINPQLVASIVPILSGTKGSPRDTCQISFESGFGYEVACNATDAEITLRNG